MAERSRSVLAAQAFERIKKLQAECEEELAGAPHTIEAKYAERIARVRSKLDPDLLVYVDGLIEAEAKRDSGARPNIDSAFAPAEELDDPLPSSRAPAVEAKGRKT